MTHTTEQERAEFEAWAAKNYHGINLEHEGRSYRYSLANEWWTAWQAARRAPAVPVPQETCVICGPDEPYTGTCGSNDPRALCKKPAPQPPEAAQLDDTNVVDMAQAVDSKEAAPVQLPEPDAYKHTLDSTEGIPGNQPRVKRTERSANPFGVPGIDYDKSFPCSIEKLYTEQQVRQLLADQQFKLDELAMLTRMVVHAFRQVAPDNKTAAKTVDYLKRKGLAGNPLRAAQEQST